MFSYMAAQNKVAKNSRLIANVPIWDQYAELNLPQIPVFHPYHPSDEEIERIDHCFPTFSICAKIESDWDNLPEDIQKILQEAEIDEDNLDVFFVTQNIPWKDTSLTFRPHGWIHQDAPCFSAAYDRVAEPAVGLFHPTQDSIEIDNTKAGSLIARRARSHNSSPEDRRVVSSPENCIISGVNWSEGSCQVMSLVILPESKRAALTVHWLLDDTDQAELVQSLTADKNLLIGLAQKLDIYGNLHHLVFGKENKLDFDTDFLATSNKIILDKKIAVARRAAQKAIDLETEIYGAPKIKLDNINIRWWLNKNNVESYLKELNNDLNIKRQVDEARALETQLYGAPRTNTFDQVSKEWWSNAENVQKYCQELQSELRIKRQVDEARVLETQLYQNPITPTYDQISKEWWSNIENAEGYLEILRSNTSHAKQKPF